MTGRPPKPAPVFQGNDWLTRRWFAAQAFDSLDKLQDLCLCRLQTPPLAAADDADEWIETLQTLLDDLASEVKAVEADVLADDAPMTLARTWPRFEFALFHDAARRALTPPPEALETLVSNTDLEELYRLFGRMKETLRTLDQPDAVIPPPLLEID
jgi:hypothetical protein